MRRNLIVPATLLLLLLASLPAALAQDEKLDLPPVHNFDFTADNTLAWDTPTGVVQAHFQNFKLYVKYLTRDSSGNEYVYSFNQEPSTSATSATLTYDTSKGSFRCAHAAIKIVASTTHYNKGTWSHATRGPCTNWNWQSASKSVLSDVDDEVAFATVFNSFYLFRDSAASRRNAAGRPSVRDGMMLSFDGRLNPHAGAPVAAFAGPDSLNFWHVLANSKGISIGSIPDVNALLQAGHAGGELLRGTHPESGKTVTVTYRPGFRMLEVSTFYADTPHQQNKLYTICIMADNNVEIVLW